MFLKRLEIVGFKSFADRITIDFVNGVTAVVGPNGSGKSNVTDAIRWVLGEQSAKHLRGGKMEDIIFVGSDSRKALNFAEVALTLDNEDHFLPIDYNEVCIMRRVYRSGDSEFFINKQSCRLKDINELLMDSGLGRDAFSIISQGKVEEILNSKPEERRTIFEEAAGVLKYKTRKRQAEQKLNETEDNLNRVRDIIFELEGQIEPLKIQASVAKEYLAKTAELEQVEVALTVYEIEQLHEKWENLKQELQNNKDKEMQMATYIQAKEAEITEIREKLTILDESIEQLQHVLLVTSEELEKLEGKRQVLKERKKNASQNRDQLENAIRDHNRKLKELYHQKEENENELASIVENLTQAKDVLAQKQQELSLYTEDIETTIESLKSDYIELLNNRATLNNDNEHIKRQLEQLAVKEQQLKADNQKYLDEREQLVSQRTELQAAIDEVKKKIDEQIYYYREEQKKLETLQVQYEKLEKDYYKALELVQKAKSRMEVLEEMEEDYSGFYQGVREVLKAKDNLPGIKGAIAELIQVEKQYEKAIETALGASMQHVVTNTEEAARQAIQYLKKHNFGRATFLPLNIIKAKSIPNHVLQTGISHPAYVGIASELVRYDKAFDAIVKNILGTVVICRDLKSANELAKQFNYHYRIVTLDGDVVNPGGSMTGGGSNQKVNSILSRKAELDELKVNIEKMSTVCEKLEQDVKLKKAMIKDKQAELLQIRELGETIREEETQLINDLKEIEWKEKNINDRLAIYDFEAEELKANRKRLAVKQQQNERELMEIIGKVASIDGQINTLSERKNSHQSSKEILVDEMNELKLKIAKAEEHERHYVSQMNSLTDTIRDLQYQVKTNNQELKKLIQEMETNEFGEEELENAAAQKQLDKTKTIDLISERRKQRMEAQHKLEDLEQETKEWKRQYKGFSELLKDEEVKLNRLDVELENRLEHLRENYLLTYEAAKEQYPLTMDPDEARKQVKLIKLAIEELGTVNLGAIDEYERVSSRYEFLMEQKNDLQQAKDTLYQVIGEMDEEMKKRFYETFVDIRSHFDHVFQELFGGGHAELKLTDPEDLLYTGVDIIAQPPGKKLQNLALLSGGERALTAIALLFSILKVRPVPFCVLDEVEAALDEANVFRFSQYLKKFSGETQFIVITHRKGTMEEADVLYGITMQESGVSKLVSVRLDEDKEVVV